MAFSAPEHGFDSHWDRMKNLPPIFMDKWTAAALAAAGIFLLIGFSLAYVNLADNQSLMVIHFDAFRGADYFGDKDTVFEILLSAAAILLINSFLANELYFRERILSYLIAFATLLFMVLILAAVNVIISVN